MKRFFILLLFSFIFSSCSTYYKTSVSLEQASIQKSKVRIETKDDQIENYQKVIKEDNTYYGVSKTEKKTMLNETEIKTIRLYDKSGSTLNSVLAGVGLAAAALALILVTGF